MKIIILVLAISLLSGCATKGYVREAQYRQYCSDRSMYEELKKDIEVLENEYRDIIEYIKDNN
jgi:hypothetical protein